MQKSPPLVGELRLIHMCSQSDGAGAMIFASAERAAAINRRPPVWVQDHVTVHREETLSLSGVPTYDAHGKLETTTQRRAAEILFARNGIARPAEGSTSSRLRPQRLVGLRDPRFPAAGRGRTPQDGRARRHRHRRPLPDQSFRRRHGDQARSAPPPCSVRSRRPCKFAATPAAARCPARAQERGLGLRGNAVDRADAAVQGKTGRLIKPCHLNEKP